MAKYETEISKDDWIEIDPSTLSDRERHLLEVSRAAYKAAKAAREQFEQAVRESDAPGTKTVFGYRFGKISIATVAATEEKARKAGKAAMSLSQYRAMLQAQGRQN